MKGQILLEVLVALVIAILITTTFVSLGAVAVRNSRFSANQATATKLAQEGIEATISIRDQNTQGAIVGVSGATQWDQLFAGNVLAACTGDASDLKRSDCTDFVLEPCTINSVSQQCIRKKTSSFASSDWKLPVNNNLFSRKIRITSSGTNILNVTVFVWWEDSSGLHKSVLSRKLQKDRLE